jgi:hypothetical protein
MAFPWPDMRNALFLKTLNHSFSRSGEVFFRAKMPPAQKSNSPKAVFKMLA